MMYLTLDLQTQEIVAHTETSLASSEPAPRLFSGSLRMRTNSGKRFQRTHDLHAAHFCGILYIVYYTMHDGCGYHVAQLRPLKWAIP